MAPRTLTAVDPDNTVIPPFPPLPSDRVTWQASTLRHWRAVMLSPMRSEFTDADMEDLYLLAVLWDDFDLAETSSQRIRLSAEIRQQGIRFGLSPIDRRRLQWEISRGEEAEVRTERIAEKRKVEKKPSDSDDPRDLLTG